MPSKSQLSVKSHLEKPCEFGVPIGNVGALAVDESGDDVAECGEGKVDLSGFLEPLPRGARLGLSLAPRQIHQVELPDPEVLLPVRTLLRALDRDGEDGVTPGAVRVHLGAAYGPVLVAHGHNAIHVIRVVHHEGGKILDIDANVRAFFDLQSEGLVLAQEIPHLFIVDLQVGYSDGRITKNAYFLDETKSKYYT